MAPRTIIAATTLLTSLCLTSAYNSNYGNSLYARSYNDDLLDRAIYRRSTQKVLARRDALDEDEYNTFHARDEPCGPGCLCARSAEPMETHMPGCLCARHMAAREAEPEADPIGDALFEHDDILFNYRRSMNAREAYPEAEADPIGDALFEHDDILFNYRRSMNVREAEPEADPIGDALFEHDDILFNYKREAEGEGGFFDDLEFSDVLYRRGIDARDAEADAEADPEADALFEHDDILFNYRRDLDTREAEADAEPDPIEDALFEHDDILFNYRRSLDPFDDIEFTDLISRSAEAEAEADAEADPDADALFEHDDILFNYKRSLDPFDEVEFTDLISREAEAEAEAQPEPEAEADPIEDALFEHDDMLFNYKRSLDPFDEIEFTDLITRSAEAEAEAEPEAEAQEGFTPWFQSATAQSRKGDYKSPGMIKAEEAARNGGSSSGGAAGTSGGVSDGQIAVAGGLGGHAFNEALDASSAGASSMDAASMDAGGLGI